MARPIPRLYFGTMTFGWSQASSKVDEGVAKAMTRRAAAQVLQRGRAAMHVDTARIYAGGDTERIVGEVLKDIGDIAGKCLVGTKAHPSQEGKLSAEGIRGQLDLSLKAMDITAVEELYLHQPDTEHALLESLRCTDALVKAGVVRVVGMSNYHADEVQRAFDLCEEHQLTKPSVYQGLYNPINRRVEAELLPLLKRHNCAFVAFNPLAAGLLTGKHRQPTGGAEDPAVLAGRFKNNPNYLPRFYTHANFAGVEVIRAACEAAGVSMVEATFRWLLRHSQLTTADGVLLGASSLAQLEENLEACEAAETADDLPPGVLAAFDEAAKLASPEAAPYWRSYSADMPGRDTRDQGLAYAVKK